MNARLLVIASALAALMTPAVAPAKTIPSGKSGSAPAGAARVQPRIKKLAPSRSRVLCICIVRTTEWPGMAIAPLSQQEFERQYDAEMVAHSLEPVFGTSTATPDPPAGSTAVDR